MKKTVTFFAIILSAILFSQELKYEQVVKVDSTTTKDELYNRARSWFSNTFKSEKDVMSIDDKSLGEISGNGAIRYDPQSFYFAANCARGYVMYKINIFVKDGRYKYNIHSFVHEGTKCPGGGVTSYGILTEDKDSDNGAKKGWSEIKELTKSRVDNLIVSLKSAMIKKHETNNDW